MNFAHAAPTSFACNDPAAPPNPAPAVGNCTPAFVPASFGNPFAGAVTIDFSAPGATCASDLDVLLATNSTSTAVFDDWLLHGTCNDAGGTPHEFCCVFRDNGAAAPEVSAIGVRGTAADDRIVTAAADDLFIDADMHPDLEGFVFGEAGDDTLIGAESTKGTTVPMTARGGAGLDILDFSGMETSVTLFGDGDVDWIEGGIGADTINGGGGADMIAGHRGSDTINAGAGDDRVCGDDNVCVLGGVCFGAVASRVLVCGNGFGVASFDMDTIRMGTPGLERSMAHGGPGEDSIATEGSPGDYFGGSEDDKIAITGANSIVQCNDGFDDICDFTSTADIEGNDGDDEIWVDVPVASKIDGGAHVAGDACAGANCEFAQPLTCPF